MLLKFYNAVAGKMQIRSCCSNVLGITNVLSERIFLLYNGYSWCWM